MKRITIIILAVVAIVASSVSCQKVNDIDKRLSDLEEVVSDLKAQVLAGAVITSVTKTDDGCTFTLSNGQSYTVTNGTNGNDGTDG
ncbi:MAG: PL29 family lyase N-terminal domain-containing protein, partial [Bacteroidales bacterium]|nr:PL29 family lyase N-terminal domain-containing protein [Bacteroidales bacterium]